MTLYKTICAAQSTVPECLAVSCVHMSTGEVLGVNTIEAHSSEAPELVATATTELFEGASVTALEQLFRRSSGRAEDDRQDLHEVMVFSDHLLHIFLRGKQLPSHAVCFICRGSVNVGMALTKARMALPTIEGAL